MEGKTVYTFMVQFLEDEEDTAPEFEIEDKFLYTFSVTGYGGREKTILLEVFEIIFTEDGYFYSLRSQSGNFVQEYIKEEELTKENGYLPVLNQELKGAN